MGLGGLRLAVPRGTLMGDTLDLLDRLGVETAEVRGNDRKLLFEDAGIVTMRPSDVPTYVEAGAADIGVTGKDVLAEQSERAVYELFDLGFGPCRLVFATVAGDDPAAEALRRLGVMRIATKYPRIAARYFERTGRQAEIVEVKGSVELAPLAGLVEGIVDVTATGTTLRENGLVIREEIVASTARLIANPVAYRMKAEAIDAARGAHPCGLSARSRTPRRSRRACAAWSRGRSRSRTASPRSSPRCARGAMRRCSSTSGSSRGTTSSSSRRAELDAALDAADPDVRAGLKLAAANVRAVAEAGVDAEAEVALPEGQTVRLREAAGAAGGRLRARRPSPYPSSVVMGAVTARAAGVDEVVVAAHRPPADPRRLRAVQRRHVYRMGGAQAIAALTYGTETVQPVDVIVGPGSLWVQEAKRQVSGCGRDRRLRRPERPDGHLLRRSRS